MSRGMELLLHLPLVLTEFDLVGEDVPAERGLMSTVEVVLELDGTLWLSLVVDTLRLLSCLACVKVSTCQ